MKAIAMPRIEGATMFHEEDVVWGLAIERYAVALVFQKPADTLFLTKKHAKFLSRGLRWLASGISLYPADDTPASETDEKGGNDPAFVELGCKLERDSGGVVLRFGKKVRKWTWSPACAEYAASRIDAEQKALSE